MTTPQRSLDEVDGEVDGWLFGTDLDETWPVPHSPRFPIDSRSQELGRRGEDAVVEHFGRNGWIVMRNRPSTDYGVDLAVFRRSERRGVLPYALAVQVKTTERVRTVDDGVPVRVGASTLSSWLWSSTPTICMLHDLATGTTWWSTPGAALASRSRATASTRTLRLTRRLATPLDWTELSNEAARQWTGHQGVGAILDLPLFLQTLTHIALETDLWTSYGDHADAVYHSAAVHAYRVAASICALIGRTPAESFVDLAQPTMDQVGESWSFSSVHRHGQDLGIVAGAEFQPTSEYLVDVFGHAGAEVARCVPRLQQLSSMEELAVPSEVRVMLESITPTVLALIDPAAAAKLTPADLPQPEDRPTTRKPLNPEFDSRLLRPLGRPSLTHPTTSDDIRCADGLTGARSSTRSSSP